MNTELPFIDIIPDEKLNDLEYIQDVIEKNKEKSITMRSEIREYGIENFSWQNIVKQYESDILKLL